MSAGKPAPSPWRIDERYPGSYSIEPDVAWLGASSAHGPGENLANAQLIAAAPEMLAALQAIATIASQPHRDRALQRIRERAIIEISKAKGQA